MLPIRHDQPLFPDLSSGILQEVPRVHGQLKSVPAVKLRLFQKTTTMIMNIATTTTAHDHQTSIESRIILSHGHIRHEGGQLEGERLLPRPAKQAESLMGAYVSFAWDRGKADVW